MGCLERMQTTGQCLELGEDFPELLPRPKSSSLLSQSAPQFGPPADPADELLGLTSQVPQTVPGGAHAPGPLRFLGGKAGMAPEDVDGAYTAASKGVRGAMSINKGRKALTAAHGLGQLGPAASQIAGWGQSAVSGAGQALAAGGRGLRNGLSTVGPALGQAWDGLGGVAQKGAGMLSQAPALAGKVMNVAGEGVDTAKYLAYLAQNDPAGLVGHTKFLGGKALNALQDGATALGGKATSALGGAKDTLLKAGGGLKDLASSALTKGKGALSSGGDLIADATQWTKNKGGEALANMAKDTKVASPIEKLGGGIGMIGGAAQAYGGLTDMKNGKVVEGGLKTGSGIANAASGYMMTVGKVGAGKMLGGAGAVLEGGMDMYSGWKNKDNEKMGVGAAKSVSGGLMMAGAATANPVLFAAGAIGYGGSVLYENRDVIAKYGGKAVTAIKTGAVDGAKWASDKASQGWDAAKATAGKTGEALKEGASWASNKVSDGASALKDGAKKIGGWLGL